MPLSTVAEPPSFLSQHPTTMLHPELQDCIIEADNGWRFVHHPRLVAVYDEFFDVMLNEQYRALSECFGQAVANRAWSFAINLYTARPYRTDTFDMLAPLMSDRQYWRVLSGVWIDQENPEDFTEEWRDRFNANRAHKAMLMTPEERQEYSQLPERVPIYRADIVENPSGLSWTTDPRVAEFFSKRFKSNHPIREAYIDKRNIAAYWTRRGESEVLVLDTSVLSPEKTSVPPSPDK